MSQDFATSFKDRERSEMVKEGYIFSGIFGLLIVLTLFLLSFVIY